MWCVTCTKARQKCLHFSAGTTTSITKAEKKHDVIKVRGSEEEEEEGEEEGEEEVEEAEKKKTSPITPQKHWEAQDYAAIPSIGQG